MTRVLSANCLYADDLGLWAKKEDAVAGGKGPWHKKARRVIPQMYESIQVKGLRLTVDDDVSDWRFEPWVEAS